MHAIMASGCPITSIKNTAGSALVLVAAGVELVAFMLFTLFVQKNVVGLKGQLKNSIAPKPQEHE